MHFSTRKVSCSRARRLGSILLRPSLWAGVSISAWAQVTCWFHYGGHIRSYGSRGAWRQGFVNRYQQGVRL